MKPSNKSYLNTLFTFFLILSINMYAQEDNTTLQKELDYLTVQQRQLLKDQQELLDNTRNIFKENLTTEQLSLIKDRSISKKQRTTLLKKSLTSKQRDLISSNRSTIHSKRNMFRRSLTKKQKLKLRKFIKKRPLSDRKRLVRRLRRLIQNNMD